MSGGDCRGRLSRRDASDGVIDSLHCYTDVPYDIRQLGSDTLRHRRSHGTHCTTLYSVHCTGEGEVCAERMELQKSWNDRKRCSNHVYAAGRHIDLGGCLMG